MKYVNTSIVFQEIPDEVTLAVNISNCPCRCDGCHSKYLWEDTGEELGTAAMDGLMARYGDEVTCVCFMGGDAEPEAVAALARYVRSHYRGVKTAWYSGRDAAAGAAAAADFDYVKFGPYVKALGGLASKSTNQRLYKRRADGRMEDITRVFWRE